MKLIASHRLDISDNLIWSTKWQIQQVPNAKMDSAHWLYQTE